MRKFSCVFILLTTISLLYLGCQKEPSNPVETAISENNPLALAKADTYTENFFDPFTMIAYVPCAAGGAGEEVELSGTLHTLIHWTYTENGGYISKWHYQPQNLTGVGLTTGDKYQGTGVTQDVITGKVGQEETYVDNFRIIGQGNDNNYVVHETFHFTINANGTMTAEVDKITIDCK